MARRRGRGRRGAGARFELGGAPDFGFDEQAAVFEAQLALAAELRRPASVHCVRAAGALEAALRGAGALPPAIALHSYSGAAAAVAQLRAAAAARAAARAPCELFFGFSWAVNGAPSGRARAHGAIRAVADDRVLRESDRADARVIGDESGAGASCALVAAEAPRGLSARSIGRDHRRTRGRFWAARRAERGRS